MVTAHLCRVLLTAVCHGRAMQTSGTRPCGNCRRVLLWVPGPRGLYSGLICFIEKPAVQYEGVRHVAKCNIDLRQAYPEDKLQGRDLVRVVGIVAPFALLGVGTKVNSFYRAPGGNVHRTCAGCL